MKRLVCISDLQCGHRAGLTPPDYQRYYGSQDHIWQKFAKIESECWNAYKVFADELNPVDVLEINGDVIDGAGLRSGGVEQITVDRNEQIKMALECIDVWRAKKIVMVRGTAYHVGEAENFEDLIAANLQCKIGDHEWLDIDGHIFDFKHHIGNSQVPYGRKTAATKDQLWNLIWAEAGLQPKAEWIIRSHVHFAEGGFQFRGDRQVWAVTTPSLQAMGTRYGATRCSGTVDFGLYKWDIVGDSVYFSPRVVKIQSQIAEAIII